jgi:hypothetical protein
MTQETQSRFDQLIAETGFLTEKGKEVLNKILCKAVAAFLGELQVDGKELTSQQIMIVKSIAMKIVSDNIPYKKE